MVVLMGNVMGEVKDELDMFDGSGVGGVSFQWLFASRPESAFTLTLIYGVAKVNS